MSSGFRVCCSAERQAPRNYHQLPEEAISVKRFSFATELLQNGTITHVSNIM